MGFVRDIVKQADNSKEVSAEIKENLSILMSLAEAKGNFFEENIKADLVSGKMSDTPDNLTVPITKVLQKDFECRAITKDSTSKIIDEIKKSMSNLFSGDGKILDGISGLINTALTAIMGAGSGEETLIKSYSVVVENCSIVRYDFAFWGRNIEAQSIKNYMENVFTCVAYKSAVNVPKLDFNTFLSLYGSIVVQSYGNDKAKVLELLQEAKKIYELFLTEEQRTNFPLTYNIENIIEDSLKIQKNTNLLIPQQ
jgi:hypothetical protein